MGNIMIVDDDVNVCKMLSEVLRAQGHKVFFAVDPAHLYTQLEGFKPDLLILDMQMPAGGAPFAQKVIEKAGLGGIPTLYHSSMPVERVREWFPPTESRRYFQKGGLLADLMKSIAELLPA